jgi:hypothetical protein
MCKVALGWPKVRRLFAGSKRTGIMWDPQVNPPHEHVCMATPLATMGGVYTLVAFGSNRQSQFVEVKVEFVIRPP